MPKSLNIPPNSSQDALRLKQIWRLALVLLGMSLMVVLVSAAMRLEGAGLGCADWPACYGQLLASDPAPRHYGPVRVLHRFSASMALILGMVLAWRAWRPYPLRPIAYYAAAILGLMLFLAVLGFWSADARRVLVGFLNIMGGLGLVTFAWRIVLIARDGAVAAGAAYKPTPLLHAGLLSLSLCLALGAWVGASYAPLSCLSLPSCDGHWWPQSAAWQALSPWLHLSAAPMLGDAGGVLINLLHRYFAVLSVILLSLACWPLARQQSAKKVRNSARWVLVLLLVEVALGALTVSSGLSFGLVIAHGVCAALLLVAIVDLSYALRRSNVSV